MSQHTPLTAAERAEAQELCNAATPGPWECGCQTRNENLVYQSFITSAGDEDVSDRQEWANGDFIAASRTLLPRALATIDALEADNQRLATLAEGQAKEMERMRAALTRLHGNYAEARAFAQQLAATDPLAGANHALDLLDEIHGIVSDALTPATEGAAQ